MRRRSTYALQHQHQTVKLTIESCLVVDPARGTPRKPPGLYCWVSPLRLFHQPELVATGAVQIILGVHVTYV